MTDQVQVEASTAPAEQEQGFVQKFMAAVDREASAGRESYQEVKIYSDHVIVSNVNGTDKAIPLVEFKKALDTQLKMDDKLTPVVLPKNCIMFSKTVNQIKINCYYPERRAKITYAPRDGNPTREIEVWMPNIILFFSLKPKGDEWNVVNSRYLATDKPIHQLGDDFIESVSIRNHIWMLPMSNIYSDAKMCFGGNAMPVKFKDNLRGLDWYHEVIFNSPFNDDLGIYASPNHTPREWFNILNSSTSFPYDKLTKR